MRVGIVTRLFKKPLKEMLEALDVMAPQKCLTDVPEVLVPCDRGQVVLGGSYG